MVRRSRRRALPKLAHARTRKTKLPHLHQLVLTRGTANVSIAAVDEMKTINHGLRAKISPRLRNSGTIKEALRHLSGPNGSMAGNLVETYALNDALPLDQRLSAITLLTSLTDGNAKLLQRLIGGDDRTLALEALKRINQFRTEWAKPALLRGLRNLDASRRSIIAWSLSAFSDDSDIERALLLAATRDENLDVRAHAIEALREFRSEKVSKTLVRILQKGSPTERFWALYSLGTLADDTAAFAVTAYCDDHTEVPGFGSVGEEARWALSRMRGARPAKSKATLRRNSSIVGEKKHASGLR